MAKKGLQEQVACLQEQLKIAQQSLQKIVHCCSDEGQYPNYLCIQPEEIKEIYMNEL